MTACRGGATMTSLAAVDSFPGFTALLSLAAFRVLRCCADVQATPGQREKLARAARKPKTALAKKRNPTEVGAAMGPLKSHQRQTQAAVLHPDRPVQTQPGQVTHGLKGLLGLGQEGNPRSKEPAVSKKVPNAIWKKVSCGEEARRGFAIPKDAANKTGRGLAAENATSRTGRSRIASPADAVSKTGRSPIVILADAASRTGRSLVVIPAAAASRTGRSPVEILADAASKTGRSLLVIPKDATIRKSSHSLGDIIPRGFGSCTPQPYLSDKQSSTWPAQAFHVKARRSPAEMSSKVPSCTYKPGFGGWKRTKRSSRPTFFQGAASAIIYGTMETRRKRNQNVAELTFPDLNPVEKLKMIFPPNVVGLSAYNPVDKQNQEADLELGDLIEVFRFGYQHWAIYVGNGFVIHLAPPSEFAGAGCASLMSTLTDKAWVKKELLRDVVGNNRYRVNNKHDSKYPPLPMAKIVRRAEEMVGQELLYKVTSENCEHFVTELRYGIPRSDQVRDAVVGIGLAGLGLAALGIIGAVVKRKKQQNQ